MASLGVIAFSGLLLVSHTPQHELAQEYRLPPEDQRIVDAVTVCSKKLDSISEVSRNRLWGPRLEEWLKSCVDHELRPKP